MQRPADLPDFDRPPVDEVVVGTFHDRTPGYSDKVPVRLYHALANQDFEGFELRERLSNQDRDPTQPPTPRLTPQIEFHRRESPRSWFITSDERSLVQLQDDLLMLNWRRRGDGGYPHFESIIEQFFAVRSSYRKVLDDEGLRLPTPSVVEVTYVNWVAEPPMHRFFRPATLGVPSVEHVEALPESSMWRSEHPLSADGHRLGRLVVHCGTAGRLQSRDQIEQGTRLTLTAKLSAKGAVTDEDLKSLMNVGRCAIVRTFTDLTTEEAHQVWERTQ